MIFSELYGAYYNTVARILKAAVASPVTAEDVRRIAAENAFGESLLNIEPALYEGRWPLLLPDGSTPLEHVPTMPPTLLQRRWLKAVSLDPRVRLFGVRFPDDPDADPLFTPDDYSVFDKYADGDPFEDEGYIRRFRVILDAVKSGTPLKLNVKTRRGDVMDLVLKPKYLEYSEKDDKFRLIGAGSRRGNVINLGRVLKVKPYRKPFDEAAGETDVRRTDEFTCELEDVRNALERVLLHFAHFEKEAVKIGENRYRVTVRYDRDDETELVIRVLSFGPVLRVTGPAHFENLVKERLKKQTDCGFPG